MNPFILLALLTVILASVIVGFYFKERRRVNRDAEQLSGFKVLGEGLQHNVADLRSQMFDLLNSYITQFSGKIDTLNRNIELRFGEINQQVGQNLSQGYEKNQNLFGEVIKRLALIDQAQERVSVLSGQLQDLQEILDDKRARGAFGETQLHMLLQEVLPSSQFSLQHNLSNGKRVDCLLTLPNAVGKIAIDAKFPLENYRRKRDESLSEPERLQAGQQFKSDVKKHILDIAEKYIVPGETAMGAIMFIPAEAIFAEIHGHYADLVQLSYQKRVWLVSPATLMALLLTVSTILSEINTYQHASEIKEQLASLAKSFAQFREKTENLAKHFQKVYVDLEGVVSVAKKIDAQFQSIQAGKN